MTEQESIELIVTALRRFKALEKTMAPYNGIQAEVLELHKLSVNSLNKMAEFASCMLANCNSAKSILDKNIGGYKNGANRHI